MSETNDFSYRRLPLSYYDDDDDDDYARCDCVWSVCGQVGEYMSTSCGGLVGLTILAIIIVAIGLLAATVTIRDGRVAPIEPDNMSFF